MAETQDTIEAWREQTFGPAPGVDRLLLRALNEMVEAMIAAGIGRDAAIARIILEWDRQLDKGAGPDPTTLPSEIAGTVICLYGAASVAGFDLHAAIDAEMARNRSRTWFRRGDGTGQHVPAPSPALSIAPNPVRCQECGWEGEGVELIDEGHCPAGCHASSVVSATLAPGAGA